MITQFLDANGVIVHGEFQKWRRDHPGGYYLAFKATARANLHAEDCWHAGSNEWMPEDDDSSLTSHRKVCSTDKAELLTWARSENVDVRPCAHCLGDRERDVLGGRAGIVPRNLLPGTTSVDVIRRLASSIRFAHAIERGERWALTLDEKQVRMTVGMPEVFGIRSDEVWFFVATDSPPQIADTRIDVEESSYANLRGAFRIAGPPNAILAVYDQLRDAHQRAITQAAKKDVNPAARKYHSKELIRHLRSALREEVPQPAYSQDAPVIFPDEVEAGRSYREGAVRRVEVNQYERDPAARAKCIDHYGAACSICDLDFGAVYGETMDGFIHVHHLRPIADVGEEYEVDPIDDLRPVCPNCHAALHSRTPPLAISDVQAMFRRRGNADE